MIRERIKIGAGLMMCWMLLLLVSCNKDWLDVKRNKSDVTPTTLEDYQAILDHFQNMNKSSGIGELGTDNYYLLPQTYNLNIPQIGKNAYVWNSDIFGLESSLDWETLYKIVEFSNIVIDGLGKFDLSLFNDTEFNNIKGQALFFRAKAFSELASLFAEPYSASMASTRLGIPLRLSSDINIPSNRSTVKETYEQILVDLLQAENLLNSTSDYQSRPTKTAASALLARVYLNMENYVNAEIYATRALNNYSFLIDYNDLPTTNYPFPLYPNNKEIIFYSVALSYSNTSPALGYGIVDSLLYKSYDSSDLRKIRFYRTLNGNKIFHGSYVGSLGLLFSGLATNELYLIRAECRVRNGNLASAMSDLNVLLRKRWIRGTYIDLITSNVESALAIILNERRKELPFTQLIRWDDLRRLNKDPRYAKTLVRDLNGTRYTLPPNDARYVYPIPINEIQISGLEQNKR